MIRLVLLLCQISRTRNILLIHERVLQLNHDTGTLIGISDMLSRGENLMKPHVSAGFLPDKPMLVLHGSGDKVNFSIGLVFRAWLTVL